MPSFSIENFGCRTTDADASAIRSALRERGLAHDILSPPDPLPQPGHFSDAAKAEFARYLASTTPHKAFAVSPNGGYGWRSGRSTVDDAQRDSLFQPSHEFGEHHVSVKTVHTDQAPAAIGPYSQGIVANGLLFTAGQIPIDPATGQIVQGDVVAQTERVMMNLTAVLGTVGATWKDVVISTLRAALAYSTSVIVITASWSRSKSSCRL